MMLGGLDQILLLGVIALVLCLGSREFGLHNLAAGQVVVLGGWWCWEIVAWATGAPSHTNRAWLSVATLPVVVLCAWPLAARTYLRDHPLIFMFASLGAALVTETTLQGKALPFATSHIAVPDGASWHVLIPVGAAAVASVVCVLVFSSGRWATCALKCRVATNRSSGVWASVAMVLVLQFVLLLGIGGASASVHRGMAGGADDRTVLAVLAVFLARARPIRAGLIGAGMGIAIHLFDHVGGAVQSLASPLTMLGAALLIVLLRWPKRPLIAARTVVPVAPCLTTREAAIRTGLAVGVAAAFVVILAAANGGLGRMPVLAYSYLLVLVLAAWALRYILGIWTVSIPLLSGCAGYGVYLAETVFQSYWTTSLVCAALVVLASAYFLLLRLLSVNVAVLCDVALVVVGASLIRHMDLSGSSQIVALAVDQFIPTDPGIIVIAEVVVGCAIVLLVLLFLNRQPWRPYVLAVANFENATRHGWRPVWSFLSLAAVVSLVVVLASLLLRLGKPTVASSELELGRGLTVLFFAYLASEASLLLGATSVGAVALVAAGVGLGYGILEVALVGALFQILGFIVPAVARAKENWNANVSTTAR